MNKEEIELIEKQLDEMIGKEYLYGNQHHTFKSWRIIEQRERFYIMTDKKEYDRPYDACMEFLNSFEPVPDKERGLSVHTSILEYPKVQVDGKAIAKLKDVLFDNIEKIKNNKDYIPQAVSIKDNVDSIIELAKTEVAYMEVFVRLNKKGF